MKTSYSLSQTNTDHLGDAWSTSGRKWRQPHFINSCLEETPRFDLDEGLPYMNLWHTRGQKDFLLSLTNLTQDVVLDPQEILALYASEAQLERGHTVRWLKFFTDDYVSFSSGHTWRHQVRKPEHLLGDRNHLPIAKSGPTSGTKGRHGGAGYEGLPTWGWWPCWWWLWACYSSWTWRRLMMMV